MFYGAILPPGKEVRLDLHAASIIHLSNAAFAGKSAEPTHLSLRKDGKTFLLAVLDQTKTPQVSLDLNVTAQEQVSLVSSKAEVHVTGYFEPLEQVVAPAPVAQKAQAPRKGSNQAAEEDLKDHEVKPKGPQKQEVKPQQAQQKQQAAPAKQQPQAQPKQAVKEAAPSKPVQKKPVEEEANVSMGGLFD